MQYYLLKHYLKLCSKQLACCQLPTSCLKTKVVQIIHTDGDIDANVPGYLIQPPTLLVGESFTSCSLVLQPILVALLHSFRVWYQLLIQGSVPYKRDQICQDTLLTRPSDSILLKLCVCLPQLFSNE